LGTSLTIYPEKLTWVRFGYRRMHSCRNCR